VPDAAPLDPALVHECLEALADQVRECERRIATLESDVRAGAQRIAQLERRLALQDRTVPRRGRGG
jgi:hypothetical protein